jgi:hypothetical protein
MAMDRERMSSGAPTRDGEREQADTLPTGATWWGESRDRR